MKKSTKIVLTVFLMGIFIHPQKVVYEANIIGKITDENIKPVYNTTVFRIEKE